MSIRRAFSAEIRKGSSKLSGGERQGVVRSTREPVSAAKGGKGVLMLIFFIRSLISTFAITVIIRSPANMCSPPVRAGRRKQKKSFAGCLMAYSICFHVDAVGQCGARANNEMHIRRERSQSPFGRMRGRPSAPADGKKTHAISGTRAIMRREWDRFFPPRSPLSAAYPSLRLRFEKLPDKDAERRRPRQRESGASGKCERNRKKGLPLFLSRQHVAGHFHHGKPLGEIAASVAVVDLRASAAR